MLSTKCLLVIIVVKLVSDLYVAESQLAVRFQPVFSASDFHPVLSPYTFKQPAVLSVKITSHLVDPVAVDSVAVSLLPVSAEAADESELVSHRLLDRQTSRSSDQSLTSTGSAASANILDLYSRVREVVCVSSQPIDLVEYVEFETDRRTVSASGVMCQSVMRHSPSTPAPSRERVVTRRGDWDLAFNASNCILQPGDNVVHLTTQASCVIHSFLSAVNLLFVKKLLKFLIIMPPYFRMFDVQLLPASVALLVASQYALPGYGDRRVWVRGPAWPDHCVRL